MNILNFGAVGDGKTLCTESFRKAIAAAKQTGERVVVPAGTYLTGTIDMQGVSMHLESGAVIKGSSNPADYPVMPYHHNELDDLQALIVCLGGENVVLDGDGTIDLNGSSFYDFSRPIVPKSRVPYSEEQKKECTVMRDWRPTLSVFFNKVKGLIVRDLTIIDAPCWTVTASECENVKLRGLTIDTSLNLPNDDGIHITACNGVIISDCNISSGDDCIAISSITNWERPCENVVISNCVMRSCSKAVVLGYQYSHVRNVMLENCIINKSHRGLCFMGNDNGGLVENVRVKNMYIDTQIRAGDWWGNGEAVFFMGVKHDGIIPAEQNPHRDTPVNYRHITVEGITCESENAIGAVGTGSNFEDVVLRDIIVKRKPSANIELKGRVFDTSPSTDFVEIPEDCMVYVKGAGDLKLENVRTLPYEAREQKIIVE